MIDWKDGYSCEWRMRKVDPGTWTEGEEVRNVYSITIDRDATDDVPLLETSSVVIDGTIDPGWYRLSMLARQDSIVDRRDLGTFRMEPGSESYYGSGRKTVNVDGLSVLQPASDLKCRIGEYAPKGANVASLVRDILRECTPAPVRVSGDMSKLGKYYVFDPGTKRIGEIWGILDSAGWCLRIEGDGTITVQPKPEIPSVIMDRNVYGILQPQFDLDSDISSIPNVYRMVVGDKEIEIVNNDPRSEVSVASRGYRLEEVDSSPNPLDGESYETYGKRQLTTLSSTFKKWSYSREFIPDLYLFDLWECRRYDIGLLGEGRILSQKLNCDKGIVVEEKIGIEVKEYVTEYVDLTGN